MFNIGLKTKLWLASDCQGKQGLELGTVGKAIALFVSKKVLGSSTIDVTIDAILHFTKTK